ncbi:hypothetical protein F383_35282 [Gossypium arboreum]|uniref:Uncharacterized protein n=1 Tax=Gossypium arboreum TaxID=29729 RepID=A0A0B0N8T2_GOSAR|nr:hypothetical protein F383_35282 [Gossypium arboreum]
MVQRRELQFKLNKKSITIFVSGTGAYLKCMRCELNICYVKCIG